MSLTGQSRSPRFSLDERRDPIDGVPLDEDVNRRGIDLASDPLFYPQQQLEKVVRIQTRGREQRRVPLHRSIEISPPYRNDGHQVFAERRVRHREGDCRFRS